MLATLLFALVAVEIGVSSIAVGMPCVETCEDDGPDGQCAPGCEDCVCCAQPRVTLVPPTTAEQPVGTSRDQAWPEQATPPVPEPHEILRVPKPASLWV